MPRSYLRLDPDFAERKRDYPDGPYRCLVDVFCAAEYEPKRGQFRSMAILRAVLGRSARHLPYLFAKHDIRLTPDDRIQVVGWDEWQEGNWQVAERMRRVRDRREGSVTPPTVTTALSAPDDPTVMVSSEPLAVSGKAVSGRQSGAARPPSPAQQVKAWLRDHEIAQPVGWEASKLNELVRLPGGPDAVIAAFEDARSNGGAITCRNFIRWAEQSIAPDRAPHPNGASPKGHTRSAQEAIDAFQR